MILQGNNLLSLAMQSGLSFEADISIDNLNGNCNLGFRDITNKNNLNFYFNKGNIFDPNNRIVYSYEDNEKIKISGNIDTGLYSYYINQTPICLNGNTNLTTGISFFYLNTNNCTADLDINIYGKRPDCKFNTSNFYIDSKSFIQVYINNSGNLPFAINSGEIVLPTGFYITDFTYFIDKTGYIKINHISQTTGQLEDEKTYEIQLDLYTNFGKITKNFTTTGSYSGFFDINLNFLNSIKFTENKLIGSEKTGDLSFYFQLASGSLRTTPQEFDKSLGIYFNYFSGETGKILFNLPIETYVNLNITGFISGSGYIDKVISFTGSGYHAISGLNVSGITTGKINEQFIITGFTNKYFNILNTGYYFNQQFILNQDYNLNLFTLNGIINYNNNISKQKYNVFSSISTGSSVSFGDSVRTNSGTFILISDPLISNLPNINSTGRVYIYSGDGKAWSIFNIYSGLNGDINFGKAIAINNTGNLISISSDFGDQINEGIISHYSGRVYLLTGNKQNINSSITFTGKGYFGNSLSINNDTLLIGAYYDNSGIGSAKIYKNEEYFSLNQRISASGSPAILLKNLDINNSGNIVVSIGFDGYIPGSITGSGVAWIFTGNQNNLTYATKLTGDRHYFGNTDVAINSSGNIIYIGGCCEAFDGNNLGAGAVWIFTGSGNNWIQQAKITGEGSGDGFGRSIAINSGGNLLAVGGGGNIPYINQNNISGGIWTFTGNSNQWIFSQKITSSGLSVINSYTGLNFGHALALNGTGNLLFASATQELESGGALYIFTGGISNFQFVKKIYGDNNPYGRFGYSINSNFNGNTIIVGSPGISSSYGGGRANIITGNGSNWEYLTVGNSVQALTGGNDNTYYSYFGLNVDIDSLGDKVIIGGSQYETPLSSSGDGALWIFRRSASNWIYSGKLKADNTSWIGEYAKINGNGRTIAASKNLTNQFSPYSGSIWILNLNRGITWQEKLYASGNPSIPMQRFGYSTDLDENGNIFMIGAPTLNSTGSVYIYNRKSGNYGFLQPLFRFIDDPISITGNFGTSVALNRNGTLGVVGVPMAAFNRGAVYIYTGSSDVATWIENKLITGTNNDQNYFGNFVEANQSGDKIIISSLNENTGAGAIYIYTGDPLSSTWSTSNQNKINKNNINNADLYSYEQFGKKFDFKNLNNKDILYVGCLLFNTVHTLTPIDFTGYIGSFIATGNINITKNFLITGFLTGIEYQKTFLNTFNIITGYYDNNGLITGLVDFKLNNYTSFDPITQIPRYSKKSFLTSGLNQYYTQIRTRNFYDNYNMVGLLTLSGASLSGDKKRVIQLYITGEK